MQLTKANESKRKQTKANESKRKLYSKPLKFLERARFSRSDFVPIEIKHDHSTHQENIGFRTRAQIGNVFFLLFPPLSHLEPQCLDLEQSVSGVDPIHKWRRPRAL